MARQLDEGKDIAKTVAAIKDANKRGALHFAAREGKTDVCKYLLEELKLDVDSKDDDGMVLILLCNIKSNSPASYYLLFIDLFILSPTC